jgi:C4-dicarboxylate-specific signal transduction histidine kinase
MTALVHEPRTALANENEELREQVAVLTARLERGEARRRAMVHIMGDLASTNRRLSDSRKAMLHILADYESDRRSLAQQTERLDNSRRALLHILSDAHQTNLRLESSRKAMIHIMGDLRDTTMEIRQREQELRDKQEQLVQAGKLATLGELTTGVAHELNNPLNNIQLYIGNVLDLLERGPLDSEHTRTELEKAIAQVGKAAQIISHLRTFGRVALVSHEPVRVNEIVYRSLSLLQEQLRLRDINVSIYVSEADPVVRGNPIQLEQVFLNILGNARDAVSEIGERQITITTEVDDQCVYIRFTDTGGGIPEGLQERIFDPFFTTKEVGQGTGLGLSITYGIVKEHQGDISVTNIPGAGACFSIVLPRYGADPEDCE